ncbi:hypothetical protein [Actibacterium sp. 188UL27-1]|uniref:hypothetical protein n=1 Tax=Actibacterium sp. 188UL27-1 TaxID=2786961 RepID=UPI00195D645A|nr:hypothetical protein [Actibacterium sp. 188UL27-1]MBM7067755.1 hypothetical protein [Actibacterium sp. 188UL27-1]
MPWQDTLIFGGYLLCSIFAPLALLIAARRTGHGKVWTIGLGSLVAANCLLLIAFLAHAVGHPVQTAWITSVFGVVLFSGPPILTVTGLFLALKRWPRQQMQT